MNETVGVVRERERERERETLKNSLIICDAKKRKNIEKFNVVNTKIYKNNKRIDCLAKVKNRVIKKMQVMHKDNICIKLLQNSLSFLRTKSNEYKQENISAIKDKYA